MSQGSYKFQPCTLLLFHAFFLKPLYLNTIYNSYFLWVMMVYGIITHFPGSKSNSQEVLWKLPYMMRILGVLSPGCQQWGHNSQEALSDVSVWEQLDPDETKQKWCFCGWNSRESPAMDKKLAHLEYQWKVMLELVWWSAKDRPNDTISMQLNLNQILWTYSIS